MVFKYTECTWCVCVSIIYCYIKDDPPIFLSHTVSRVRKSAVAQLGRSDSWACGHAVSWAEDF